MTTIVEGCMIQHVMDYYLYMFCVEQCAVAVMCATGKQ